MKKRCLILLKYLSIILIIGLCYALIIEKIGFAIPCVFRKIIGFKCPGCGLTLICMSILRFLFLGFDIKFLKIAFDANPFIFCIFPFITYFVFKYIIVWLRTGNGFKETVFEKTLISILLVLTLIWTIYRNIYL